MRIVFRADASRVIGSGHVMRVSVVAEEAIDRGITCIFVGTISELDWVRDRIEGLGFNQIITSFNDLEGDTTADVLVIDSYTLNPFANEIQKINWAVVVSISDEMTPNFDVDICVKPSLDNPSSARNPITLSGPNYILVRKTIKKISNYFHSRDVLKILVVGGGSDPFGFATAVSSLLDSIRIELEVHFFSEEMITSFTGKRFVCHRPGPTLDEIANDFDLVLTTASTSSLEFIARECATGVVCAVDNQRDYYNQLGTNRYAHQFGERSESGVWNFDYSSLENLVRNEKLRFELQRRIRGLIDMSGASRIVSEIVNFSRNMI